MNGRTCIIIKSYIVLLTWGLRETSNYDDRQGTYVNSRTRKPSTTSIKQSNYRGGFCNEKVTLLLLGHILKNMEP